MKIRLLTLFLSICFSASLSAQTIIGRWEGIMQGGAGTFLQININQKGVDLCGFTFDYLSNNKNSFCKASFEGKFNNKEQQGFIVGKSLLANSGGHSLMKIKLWREKTDNKNVLRGTLIQDGLLSVLFGSGSQQTYFELKRVSAKPNVMKEINCFPVVTTTKKNAQQKSTVSTTYPLKKVAEPTRATVQTTTVVSKITDTVISTPKTSSITKPVISDVMLIEKMKNRKKNEQSRVVINTYKLNLKIYDNGYVDQDTISVFYNGKLLISKQGLSEKPVELNVDLDTEAPFHEITLFAENLGTIPPNTALIVVTAGGKRYELRSKANLQENAVLVFEVRKE